MFQIDESASEMVAQRGRVMGRSLKNAVYLTKVDVLFIPVVCQFDGNLHVLIRI